MGAELVNVLEPIGRVMDSDILDRVLWFVFFYLSSTQVILYFISKITFVLVKEKLVIFNSRHG